MLSAILRNALSNAVDHTPPGGEITCRLEPSGAATWILDVRNTNDSRTAADLPHLGEPFWRLAADRSDHTHAGLGLALIRTYSTFLDMDVRTELVTPECFRLALTIAQAHEAQQVPPA
jgi:signal transduction histidine kinase